MLGGIVMADAKVSSKPVHDLVLNSRERLSINGIKEIISFDESNVNIKTLLGELSIEGSNIHINILNIDKGELELQGKTITIGMTPTVHLCFLKFSSNAYFI